MKKDNPEPGDVLDLMVRPYGTYSEVTLFSREDGSHAWLFFGMPHKPNEWDMSFSFIISIETNDAQRIAAFVLTPERVGWIATSRKYVMGEDK